ncbi:MAG: S-methyl-5'-thioadenosine phosphorylase [Firmicutes bacterium]|nr:S-methyl-5'-thioadenosine phosphorylase [Bacillota bacterium]
MDYAIIGGTGVYDPKLLDNVRTEQIHTPYGDVEVSIGTYRNWEIAFLARHGSGHSIAPHKINYRANIWALKYLDVKQIISTNAVGSVNPQMGLGDFVIIDQFLDFTKQREHTFFTGEQTPVVHIDVTNPYCPNLRQVLIQTGQDLGLKIHPTGCYVCFEGPRYETAAEIKMVSMLGGDLVGMTNVPEVTLAREAGICYATVCIVTNMAAGISESSLSHEEVVQLMDSQIDNVRHLALETFFNLKDEACNCCTNQVSLPGLEGK